MVVGRPDNVMKVGVFVTASAAVAGITVSVTAAAAMPTL
jgi:hypothetical protein